MWDPPAWWSWLWVTTIVALVALRLLADRRRRRGRLAAATDARRTAADQYLTPRPLPRLASVSWQPMPEPMGPVSGWPHALEPPDVRPTGSPEDRPDLAYS